MVKDFGLLLIYARKNAGLTQEQAAELLEKDVRTISKYESNQSKPPIDVMDKICDIYQDDWIGYEYLQQYKLGQRLFTHIKEQTLAENTLSLAVNFNRSKELLNDLMTICMDGKISLKEKPKYIKILNALRLVAKDIMLLRFLGNKKANSERRVSRY